MVEIEERVAADAAILLNEAVRELTVPQHLAALCDKYDATPQSSERYSAAVRRIAISAVVNGIYRVRETRQHLLCPWLFSDEELSQLGLPDVETFVGDWAAFEVVRSQWAAHAPARRSRGTAPGQLVAGEVLGRAIVRTGLDDEAGFLARVRDDLVPGIENVRNAILQRHPGAREVLTTDYPRRVQQGVSDEQLRREKGRARG